MMLPHFAQILSCHRSAHKPARLAQARNSIIIIIIMLGCITCCALHAGLRYAQVLLALHASPLRPADLLRLCSARFFFDAGFAHNVRLIDI